MTDKYSLEEKKNILREWFEEDNILKRPLDGLERHSTEIDDDVIQNRKLIAEVLKLEGDDVIRFAIARSGDCTCKDFVSDKDDMLRIRNLLLKVYPLEEYPI